MLFIAVFLHVVNCMQDHSICSRHNCSFISLRWWNVLSFLFIGNNEENSKSSQAPTAVDCACLIVSSQGRTESLAAINMQYFLRLERERERVRGERAFWYSWTFKSSWRICICAGIKMIHSTRENYTPHMPFGFLNLLRETYLHSH